MKTLFNLTALLAIIYLLTQLAGCGGGSDSNEEPTVFRLWTEIDSNTPVDLTGGDFNQAMDFNIFTTTAEICLCSITLIGDNSTGIYSIPSCRYVFGTGTGMNPGCNLFVGGGTYAQSGGVLEVCNNLACTKYH